MSRFECHVFREAREGQGDPGESQGAAREPWVPQSGTMPSGLRSEDLALTGGSIDKTP